MSSRLSWVALHQSLSKEDNSIHLAAKTPEFPNRKGSGVWGQLEVCLKAILAAQQALDLVCSYDPREARL